MVPGWVPASPPFHRWGHWSHTYSSFISGPGLEARQPGSRGLYTSSLHGEVFGVCVPWFPLHLPRLGWNCQQPACLSAPAGPDHIPHLLLKIPALLHPSSFPPLGWTDSPSEHLPSCGPMNTLLHSSLTKNLAMEGFIWHPTLQVKGLRIWDVQGSLPSTQHCWTQNPSFF